MICRRRQSRRSSQGTSISFFRKSVKREKQFYSTLLFLVFQLGMVKEADSQPTRTISETIMDLKEEEVNQTSSQSQKSQAVMEWLLGN